MTKRTLETELSEDFFYAVERIASYQGRSIDDVINTAVGIYVQRFPELLDQPDSKQEENAL